jgi:hypothetical protein
MIYQQGQNYILRGNNPEAFDVAVGCYHSKDTIGKLIFSNITFTRNGELKQGDNVSIDVDFIDSTRETKLEPGTVTLKELNKASLSRTDTEKMLQFITDNNIDEKEWMKLSLSDRVVKPEYHLSFVMFLLDDNSDPVIFLDRENISKARYLMTGIYGLSFLNVQDFFTDTSKISAELEKLRNNNLVINIGNFPGNIDKKTCIVTFVAATGEIILENTDTGSKKELKQRSGSPFYESFPAYPYIKEDVVFRYYPETNKFTSDRKLEDIEGGILYINKLENDIQVKKKQLLDKVTDIFKNARVNDGEKLLDYFKSSANALKKEQGVKSKLEANSMSMQEFKEAERVKAREKAELKKCQVSQGCL